ncbi:MAG: DNA primase small subunit PriS [Candidatus Methanomethyliaceae archaeon]|nr:DNA primase small subunit PriS [Candidatus Methanomethyliaceae archaeon]
MMRHRRFLDEYSLRDHLMHETPAHVYYSSAYYKEPQAQDMNKKGWSGADLVFDVDADHIPTECKNDHDKWKCLDCGAEGGGFPPESCPSCGKKRIETTTWVCEKCLDVTKNEVFKLLDDYLIPDFGVSLNDVEICFSGHRGYHLHILTESMRGLTSDGRREIADYVRGTGLDQKLHGFLVLNRNGPLIGPDIRDGGWRGRIVRSMYTYISRCNVENMKTVIGSGSVAETLCRNRDRILEGITRLPPSWVGLKGVGVERLSRIARASVKEILCNIDERVTLDVKRLIRYPNTLHGKSGLKSSRITYNDLEGFDPLRDAVAFKNGIIKVYVREAPRVRIGDHEVGPLKEAEVEVPKALGIYLICKGVAEPRK